MLEELGVSLYSRQVRVHLVEGIRSACGPPPGETGAGETRLLIGQYLFVRRYCFFKSIRGQ